MKEKTTKALSFMKKNAIYFILGLCVLAIGLSVTLMLLTKDNSTLSEPDHTVQTPPVEDETPDDKPTGDLGAEDKPVENPTPDMPSEPVVTEITFIMPVANATSIEEYSETMVFNPTLSRYTAHLATDFYAAEGTNVLAVYGGKVEKVENSLLTGVTVTIDHGDGLKTIYNSLTDAQSVVEGQTVKQGDVIGTVSTSNRQEYKSGAHLHFQVSEDGKIINPEKYLTFEEK